MIGDSECISRLMSRNTFLEHQNIQLRAEVERLREKVKSAFAYGESAGRERLQEKLKELLDIKEADDGKKI